MRSGERRIVTEVSPVIVPVAAKDREHSCRATIRLDAKRYRCGREIISGFHEGIHDAFAVHSDGGMVRW